MGQNLKRDIENQTMHVSRGIVTKDISTPELSSPLSVTTAITEINFPLSAAEMVIDCDVALRISEDPAMASYFVMQPGGQVIQGTDLNPLYIATDAGSGTVSFYFHVI